MVEENVHGYICFEILLQFQMAFTAKHQQLHTVKHRILIHIQIFFWHNDHIVIFSFKCVLLNVNVSAATIIYLVLLFYILRPPGYF